VLNEEFLTYLEDQLRPRYALPAGVGGHDVTHVERMVAMEPKIATILDFDPDEYVVAAWLHNIDRNPETKKRIKEEHISIQELCHEFLVSSPFDGDARVRIVNAVVQHPKKDDDPGDSTLLTALRIADKIDRMGPLGVIASTAFRGSELPPYDTKHPFGYSSTVEGKLRSIYNDLFRILEWYGMLPSEKARALVNRERLLFFVNYIRELGAEIAETTRLPNRVEDDIRRALGDHYWDVTRNKVEAGQLTLINEDSRRKIYEWNFLRSSVQCFDGKAGIEKPLGNHHHPDKDEVFLFREAEGYVLTYPVDSEGKRCGAQAEWKIGPMVTIRIPRYTAHRFVFTKPSPQFECFSSAPFNKYMPEANEFDEPTRLSAPEIDDMHQGAHPLR